MKFSALLIVSLIAISLVAGGQAFADPLQNAFRQRIGNYDVEMTTEPKSPLVGSPTNILIRIAGVNGDDLVDTQITIRLVKDGAELQRTNPIIVPYGHHTFEYTFAHEFTGDESASFLALVESLKVELDLVQSNLASNVTLAEEHAEHAHEHLDDDIIEEIGEKNERLARDLPAALEDLHDSVANSTAQQVQTKIQNINDLLGETVSVRVESEQMSNSTVWALVLAYMADGVLEHYGAAYGMETDEGQGHGHDGTETASTEESMTDGMEMDENMTTSEGNDTIVSTVHYQSAQGMVARMQELFSDQVKELAPANSTEAVADFEGSLIHLKQAIGDREPFTHVEVLVHSEVHPSLQKAFNLQVIPEFPLPLLLMIPAIAGIIAATRINALRRK